MKTENIFNINRNGKNVSIDTFLDPIDTIKKIFSILEEKEKEDLIKEIIKDFNEKKFLFIVDIIIRDVFLFYNLITKENLSYEQFSDRFIEFKNKGSFDKLEKLMLKKFNSKDPKDFFSIEQIHIKENKIMLAYYFYAFEVLNSIFSGINLREDAFQEMVDLSQEMGLYDNEDNKSH